LQELTIFALSKELFATMAQKPSIPNGTRDFSPAEMVNRNYIFDTIKSVFKLYGYLPIETPAMENLSTLMGKYGEEGDKLLFKILNSGDFLAKTDDALLATKNSVKVTTQISEKGLRYDLTVPFARYVVQHQNEITFPFKRYQIQPVWRADRPQKGRYREFFQCDVDVVGSNSLINEVELIQIVDEVYRNLNINVLLKINNRKILAGIAQTIGEPDKMVDITVAIDKLDKIGLEKVNAELEERGLSLSAIEKLQPIIKLAGSNSDKLAVLKQVLSQSETGLKGIEEVETIFKYIDTLNIATEIELDLTLARGLNYYTGAIFEVKAKDVAIGSITGGGRYDDLTGIFGLKDVSGVGISFGADRIYDVMQQLDLFPKNSGATTQVLFTNFGEKEELFSLKLVQKVRLAGLNAELFPESSKIKKQMNYADKKAVPFVAIVGEDEIQQQKITLKNMSSGVQQLVTIDELIEIVKRG
jgi:histidyl-tRNA synthetase